MTGIAPARAGFTSAAGPVAKVILEKPQGKPNTLFKRRDVNSDGFVTLTEHIGNPKNRDVKALPRQFKTRDKHEDERWSLEQIKRGQ